MNDVTQSIPDSQNTLPRKWKDMGDGTWAEIITLNVPKNISLLVSAARTASTVSATIVNQSSGGMHLILDVTAVPGVDTITPTIQGYDPVSDKWYPILVGNAIVATGMTVLKVHPGIASVANGAASDMLPWKWRLSIAHSAASSFTYSASANIGV